jgi:hypothetical protein
VLIDIVQHFVNGGAGAVAVDAQRLDFSQGPHAPAMFDQNGLASPREGRAPIVDQSFVTQACERGLDGRFGESSPMEPIVHLGRGQLSTGQQGKRDRVGIDFRRRATGSASDSFSRQSG